MALHTKKQFAELCGLTIGNLSNYSNRGKVVYSGDYVDDQIEPNISFLNKWATKNKAKLESEETQDEQDEVVINVKTDNRQFAEPEIKTKPLGKIREPKIPHQSKTEILKNELLVEQIGLIRQKRNKGEGELIPIDLVKQSGQTSFKNCAIAFRNILEKRLTRWSKKFTPEEMAKERSETLRELNQEINNAVDESKKSIAEIISISSNKKEVGERE